MMSGDWKDGYLTACTEAMEFLTKAVSSGWDTKKSAHEWANKMQLVARENNVNLTPDDPRKYLGVFEVREVEGLSASDENSGARGFGYSFSRAASD